MSKKTENAEFAKVWCEQVEASEKWMNYVEKSVKSAVIRKGTLIEEEERLYARYKIDTAKTVVLFTSDKTHSTIVDLMEASDDTCVIGVLNFASYYKPGGGFIKGSFAQEESLCAVSGLYQVLRRLPVYAQRAYSKCVSSCYDDEIMYTSNVPITTDIGESKYPKTVDVVSCSAPNCNRVGMTDYEEYEKCLEKRIEAIYLLPYLHGDNTLVLGSWGCGVFKNNPKTIARHFGRVIKMYPNLYNKIVFACGSEVNRKMFEETIFGKSE